jgi:hypothetical protein
MAIPIPARLVRKWYTKWLMCLVAIVLMRIPADTRSNSGLDEHAIRVGIKF